MNAIDVVIVAYRSEAVIGACLERAFAIPGVGRVVVVDNGDGASAAAATHLGANAIEHENTGFGSGQNAGVAMTQAPFVLLLNPDALIEPDAVANGVHLLQERGDVAAVQGVIVNHTTGMPERSHGRPLGLVHLVGRALGGRRLARLPLVRSALRHVSVLADFVDRAPSAETLTESLAATAILVRRAAFDAVGGFDERYFLYGEDVDLCRRLTAAGWHLMAVPERWAQHDCGASAANNTDRERAWWGGTMQYAARWWSPGSVAAAAAAATIAWARVVVRNPGVAGPAWRDMVSGPLAIARHPR